MQPTMYVQGRHLYDTCGEEVVLIGPNHPTVYVDRSGAAIPEIAKTGANAVRLFWFATHDIAISEAEPVIAAAAKNGMFPMLEMHDATGPGKWDQMDAIVDYWTSEEAVDLIARHERYLLVNIANEAGPGRGQDYMGFQAVYEEAIARMRDAGIRVPLVIDASGWGRDHNALLSVGQALVDHDPLHNLLLSWHAYEPLSRTEIAEILDEVVSSDLPWLIGEFANRSPIGTCGPALDYTGLIAEANERKIGWMPWSWGNPDENSWWNGDCWEFDMTRTLSFETLERWGLEVAVTSQDSMKNVAVRSNALVDGTCQPR